MSKYPSNSVVRRIAVQAPDKLAMEFIQLERELKRIKDLVNLYCQQNANNEAFNRLSMEVFNP